MNCFYSFILLAYATCIFPVLATASVLGEPSAGGGSGAAAGAAISDKIEEAGDFLEAPAEGMLAKIELLRTRLTDAPFVMRGASLLHGALLWETGIIKSLYYLLVTPNVIEGTRWEPSYEGTSILLGKFLMQFFYMAGGTLIPTKNNSSIAYNLDSIDLGRLYKKVSLGESGRWQISRRTIKSKQLKRNIGTGKKNNEKFAKKFFSFRKTIRMCQEMPDLHQKQLLSSIIAAFFWAKFIVGIGSKKEISVEQAKYNIDQFLAASIVPGEHETAASDLKSPLAEIEAEVINRIKMLYQYNIPNPLPWGTAIINDALKFSDCVENAMRSLLCTAFYDIKNQKFVIPQPLEGAVDFYAPELRAYFEKFPSVSSQSSTLARDEWAALCGNRSEQGIEYNKDTYELKPDFKNVTNLLKVLVPGLAQESGAGAAADLADEEHELVSAKHVLQQFCDMHDVSLVDFNTKPAATEWHIKSKKPGDDACVLVVGLNATHMYSYIKGMRVSTFGQILDPILGGSDALNGIAKNQDAVLPLIHAAARVAGSESYRDAYAILYGVLEEPELLAVKDNIIMWARMNEQENYKFNESFKNNINILLYASERGLLKTVCKLVDEGTPVNMRGLSSRFEAGVTPLLCAAGSGKLDVVKALVERGADSSIRRYDPDGIDPETPGVPSEGNAIQYAIFAKHVSVVAYLLEQRPDLLPGLLTYAALYGAENVVEYLLENKMSDVNEQRPDGRTALAYARQRGHDAVVALLLKHGAVDASIERPFHEAPAAHDFNIDDLD